MQPLALSDPGDQAARREIRRASGFGCIRCGCTVFQYRSIGYIDRPDADQTILLCPPCGHVLQGKPGMGPALRSMSEHPLALHQFFDRRRLPYGDDIPQVVLANQVVMRNVLVPVMFRGVPVLRVGPAEMHGGAIDMSIALGARGGQPERIVRSNQWMIDDDSWTFARPGNRYVITSRDQSAQMILATVGPGQLALEKLRTFAEGRMLEIGLDGVRVDGVVVQAESARWQLVGLAV